MFDLAIDGPIARLRLSRPEARNAIPLSGWTEMASEVARAVDNDAQVLILSGVPDGVFCAGADISDFDSFLADPDARTRFRQAIRQGLDGLRDLPIPTIAFIEGACYGAGVAVAMACDIRIVAPQAQFAITPAKLGISYPQEDVHRLVSLVGEGQAARLLFTAASIDAEEAHRIGLVELLADSPDELASAFAANAPNSLRTLKRSLRLAAKGAASDEAQDQAFENLLGSEALAERLARYRSRK
ncbi:MAG TPA: enoyl-CoA hydratase-related protein [Allosphingosinicella sp.]|uniref:enoyl-CoA hydratase/isomerase family protein n=1 Tax=Allosphingosinicella sp. TaxID=2823234 RepID=UPI002ED92CED